MESKVIKSYDKKWLSTKCRNFVDQYELLNFLCEVAVGKFFTEQIFETRGGRFESRPVYPDIRDRLRAVEILLDRGYGKSVQEIDIIEPESIEEKSERRKRILELIEYKNVA